MKNTCTVRIAFPTPAQPRLIVTVELLPGDPGSLCGAPEDCREPSPAEVVGIVALSTPEGALPITEMDPFVEGLDAEGWERLEAEALRVLEQGGMDCGADPDSDTYSVVFDRPEGKLLVQFAMFPGCAGKDSPYDAEEGGPEILCVAPLDYAGNRGPEPLYTRPTTTEGLARDMGFELSDEEWLVACEAAQPVVERALARQRAEDSAYVRDLQEADALAASFWN